MNKPTKGYSRTINLHHNPNPESSSTNDRPLPEDEYGCDVDGNEVWEEEIPWYSKVNLEELGQILKESGEGVNPTALQDDMINVIDRVISEMKRLEESEQEVFAPVPKTGPRRVFETARACALVSVEIAEAVRGVSEIAVDVLANVRACYAERAKSLPDRAALAEHAQKYNTHPLPEEVSSTLTAVKVEEVKAKALRREAAKQAGHQGAFEVGSFIMDATIRNKEVRSAVSSWMASCAAASRDRARARFEIRLTNLQAELQESKAKVVKAVRDAKG